MSTALLEKPELIEANTDEPDECHLFCCYPEVSLCGLPIPDGE